MECCYFKMFCEVKKLPEENITDNQRTAAGTSRKLSGKSSSKSNMHCKRKKKRIRTIRYGQVTQDSSSQKLGFNNQFSSCHNLNFHVYLFSSIQNWNLVHFWVTQQLNRKIHHMNCRMSRTPHSTSPCLTKQELHSWIHDEPSQPWTMSQMPERVKFSH